MRTPEDHVSTILLDMIRQHDIQGVTGISRSDLADYTNRIIEALK